LQEREGLLLSGLTEIYRGVESGELKPVLDRTFPLTRDGAVEAHQYIHDRRNLGKVVLTN
jgi:NADPH:quinone reductase-like Zn-dependent oxidoreductase